jgi:3-methyladenine DNA glycosylase Tag
MGEELRRCWGDDDPLMEDYHDNEWGKPEHDDKKLFEHLMLDGFQAGLNRLKIKSAITNAQAFLAIKEEFGSFDKYIWGFTDHKTIKGSRGDTLEGILTSSPESDAMSKDLKARGFKFVGTTICYAFMQAVGMVDDHLKWCFRSKSL